MQNHPIRLGFIPIARPTFDIPLATEVTTRARAHLQSAGFALCGSDVLISTPEQAQAVADELAANPPDLLVIFQATFADSTMTMHLAQAVDAPLLMWAVPEARTGGRLRLNSLCGINLTGHSLTRAGYRYKTLYAAPDDPAVIERLRVLGQAGRVRRLLRGARIGRVGEHPAGFDTCRFDREALHNRLGVDVVQLDLSDVFGRVRAADGPGVETITQDLRTRVGGLDQVDQTALRGTLSTYLALRDLAHQERLAGLAVRCWPEFFTDLGCAACGALSLLSDQMTPCSCEADVNGTITQLILQWISGEPAFGSDVVAFDLEQDAAVFWHCGLAPLATADPLVQPRATIHSNRQLPLLMEFPLKPGRVTIARLSEATGTYRLVVGGGEMIAAPMSFTGTSGLLRFDRPAAEVLNIILGEGLEHHLSLTYGDHVPVLLALAEMLELAVLPL